MFEEVDKEFEEIKKVALSNNLPQDIICKAYEKAKELHFNQKRKDGSPYLIHPVEVALILAKLDFDENVICGALLHDTIEDCDYSKEQLKIDFNETILKLVDSVSAIDKAKYIFDEKDLYEDPEFIKSSTEEQTYKKLITLGKNNPCGFAIKFADRLNNLRTISVFDYNKQLEKVRETEKWVLPIAKALKSEYFYRSIKNECFKIINRNKINQYINQYITYHNSNVKNVNHLVIELKELFANSSIKDIKIKNVREYKVFEDLTKLYKNLEITKVTQGQILNVANYNIYMLYTDVSHKKATDEVVNILNNKTRLKVIDAKIGNFTTKMYFEIEDEIKNKYNLYVMSKNDYAVQKVGTLSGLNIELLDEENISELGVDFIKVRTISGESKYIAKNSTTLDFAFKIHKDIGFAFKYAIINGSKTKFPPYTKLNDGDQVEIVVDRDENGNMKNNSQLKWLAYVNTELAKKVLIKWFESTQIKGTTL